MALTLPERSKNRRTRAHERFRRRDRPSPTRNSTDSRRYPSCYPPPCVTEKRILTSEWQAMIIASFRHRPTQTTTRFECDSIRATRRVYSLFSPPRSYRCRTLFPAPRVPFRPGNGMMADQNQRGSVESQGTRRTGHLRLRRQSRIPGRTLHEV